MPKKKTYTSDDIQVLSDKEHVRLRTQIYLGNMHTTTYDVPIFTNKSFNIQPERFVPAVYKSIGEILDNCIDEFAQNENPKSILRITADPEQGEYTIADNGRGVPIDVHETGNYTPEVVFGSLRSGRNFKNEKDAGVIGQNGVGSSVVNFCSSKFNVRIVRDKKVYTQNFRDGAEFITTPKITKTTTTKTGTEIHFKLDGNVFSDVSIPEEMMHSRAIEIAFNNPSVTVEYNKHKYNFKKGFEDVVKTLSKDYYCFKSDTMEFYVVFDVPVGVDEQVFTWVNSSLLFDGGLCNTQFLNAFYDNTIKHLETAAKKQKCEVTKNDVRKNLLVFGILKIKDPEYDAQSKTRLTGPNLRKEMAELVANNWTAFARKNKQWLNVVLERANDRHHLNENKKATKELAKQIKKKVPGLVDANSKNRFECQLLITEGLSAASMITDVRDPKTIGSFPLTGKLNNVYGSTVAQVQKMGKLTNLLAAIGLIPGQKANRSLMRFGRVTIATDADPDGGDIFTLLVNLFYQFWPELFDPEYEPVIYRLVAPNVCAVKGNKRVHFANRESYEKVKSKYKGWEIHYYKGLGSMEREDWEMVLSNEDCYIPILDDGNMTNTLELLFGPDSNARKEWLQYTEE